jgi:hypothetical protein
MQSKEQKKVDDQCYVWSVSLYGIREEGLRVLDTDLTWKKSDAGILYFSMASILAAHKFPTLPALRIVPICDRARTPCKRRCPLARDYILS